MYGSQARHFIHSAIESVTYCRKNPFYKTKKSFDQRQPILQNNWNYIEEENIRLKISKTCRKNCLDTNIQTALRFSVYGISAHFRCFQSRLFIKTNANRKKLQLIWHTYWKYKCLVLGFLSCLTDFNQSCFILSVLPLEPTCWKINILFNVKENS